MDTNDKEFIEQLMHKPNVDVVFTNGLGAFLASPNEKNMSEVLKLYFILPRKPGVYVYEDFDRLLQMEEANPNTIMISSSNIRLIHMAVQQPDNVGFVISLVKHGADVNAKNNLEWTPLHFATHKDQIPRLTYEDRKKYVKSLVSAGARTNEYNSDGNAPLHLAVFNGANRNISLLLENGADVNIPHNVLGVTPLELAREYGNDEAIDILERHEVK